MRFKEIIIESPVILNQPKTDIPRNGCMSKSALEREYYKIGSENISPLGIIDLYLVTQAYYTQFQNWINDSTGTVPLPPKPTIQEIKSYVPIIVPPIQPSYSVGYKGLQFQTLSNLT